MVRWISGMILPGLFLGAAWTGGAPELRAQDADDGEEAAPCVCVDDLEDRIDVDRILERVRRRVRRSLEEVENLRLAHPGRAHLGIEIRPEQSDAMDARGIRVVGVRAGGPAQGAGIREGDVIVSVDGVALVEPLPDSAREDVLDPARSAPVQRLTALLADGEPGDTVEILYARRGERESVPVELGSRPRPWAVAHHRSPPSPRPVLGLPFPERAPVAGLRVETLGPELGAYFGTDEGVLVLAVAEDTPLGLRSGDVVLAVEGRAVEDAGDLRRILASYQAGEEIELRVRREGAERTVTGSAP